MAKINIDYVTELIEEILRNCRFSSQSNILHLMYYSISFRYLNIMKFTEAFMIILSHEAASMFLFSVYKAVNLRHFSLLTNEPGNKN